MQATAAPQEPVPEDAVSPTPRSQKRTSISRREITFTNSTFVRRGNSSFLSISRPSPCQSTAAKSQTNNVQWGLPMEVTETGSTPLWVRRDRKSTRLNSSHGYISYAVFCLKKKKKKEQVYKGQKKHEEEAQ